MNLQDYREDLKKQVKGSPFYVMGGDSHIDVARAGTPEYFKQIEEIKLELYGFEQKDVDNNLVVAHWLCEYGITGWDGLLDGDNSIRYSKPNARKIFLNPEYFLSLNALLINHASDFNNYLTDATEKDIEQIKKS